MPRKKTVELVEEIQSPKALIINGGEVSSRLTKTLEERGCVVEKFETYSPIHNKFNYIFLFDNSEVADEVYENNLLHGGKFILVLTNGDISSSLGIPLSSDLGTKTGTHSRFRILKIGDPAFWSLPELAEKILKAIFSSDKSNIVDLSRKPKQRKAIPSKVEGSLTNESLNISRDSSTRPADLVGMTAPLVEKTQRINFKKLLVAVIFIFFGLLLIIAGLAYWQYLQLQKSLANLEYHLKTADMAALADDFKDAKTDLKRIKTVYDFSTSLIFPFKNTSIVKNIGTILADGKKAAESGIDFSTSVSEVLPKRSGFGPAGENLSAENLEVLEKKLANFAAVLIETQQDLDKVNIPYFPAEKVKVTLSPFITKLTSVYEIISPMRELFFQETPKVYLVLLQNNMELRPTGGFIGSFGLLTVDNGQIADFKIQDVYEADGQLKGHVEPPLPIRRYLAQPNFFLRDSNFDPDFAASAVQASWFLEKELGKAVDGVIGLNLTLAQKLLQAIDPIKLSDFGGEEITADNFFYKIHSLSQTNFFPGSTQKKDVLTATANSIFAKLTETSSPNFVELVPIIKQALEEKNILIYLVNPQLQKIIEDHAWAGRVAKVSCVERKNGNTGEILSGENSCLPDYISINEANLGVNKANYFISKSTVIEKKIQADDQIKTAVTISYENSVNNLLLPPQQYVNYLRIFTPLGSKLESVTLNNAPINTADIDTETYAGDKTVFGFLVKIAPENKGVVKITYTLPRSFSSDIDTYQLFYQKQPGDKNSPLVLSLTYPSGLKLTPVNFSSTTQKENEIFYTTDTSVDRVFALSKE